MQLNDNIIQVQNAILSTIISPFAEEEDKVKQFVANLQSRFFLAKENKDLVEAIKALVVKLETWDATLLKGHLEDFRFQIDGISAEQNPLPFNMLSQYYKMLQVQSLETKIRNLHTNIARDLANPKLKKELEDTQKELESIKNPLKSAKHKYKKHTLNKQKTENIQDTTYISTTNTIVLNTISMLFSDSGVGKTRNAIAEANTALTEGSIDSVVVLDFDMGIKSLKKRGYDELVEKWGEEKFFYLIGQELADAGIEPKQVLADFADDQEDYSRTLFILDNGSSFIYKDDSEQVDGLFKQLKKLRAKGATTILIHHTRKSGDDQGQAVFYGSYAWKKHIDYQYLLQQSALDQEIFLWKVAKNRDGEIKDRAFKIQDEKLYPVNFDSLNLSKIEIDFIKATKEILQDGSYNQHDLIKEIKQVVSVGDIRARKLLAKFAERGEWITEKGDKNATIYSLPQNKNDQTTETKMPDFGTVVELDTKKEDTYQQTNKLTNTVNKGSAESAQTNKQPPCSYKTNKQSSPQGGNFVKRQTEAGEKQDVWGDDVHNPKIDMPVIT
jgi:hypothetical protein